MWQETGRTTLWALHLLPRQQLNKTRPCTPPSPFSPLRIIEVSERGREIVSCLSETRFAQGYVSLFLPSRLSPPFITQQQAAAEGGKKKKEGVTECSSHWNSFLLSQKNSHCPGMKVQQVKETQEHTRKGSLQQRRLRLILLSMSAINQLKKETIKNMFFVFFVSITVKKIHATLQQREVNTNFVYGE